MSDAPTPAPATPAPTEKKEAELTTIGKILMLAFCLSVFAFGLAQCSWMESIDRPSEDTYLVAVNRPWIMAYTTSQKSIKGLNKVDDGLAVLALDGAGETIPIPFKDTGEHEWEQKIEIVQHWLVAAATKGLDNVTITFKVVIPKRPDLIGRTGTLNCNFIVRSPNFPSVTDTAAKGQYVVRQDSSSKSFKVKIVSENYQPTATRVESIAKWVAGLCLLIGLVRIILAVKKEMAEEAGKK